MSLFPDVLFQSGSNRNLDIESGIDSALQFLSSCSEVEEVVNPSKAVISFDSTPPATLSKQATTISSLKSGRKVKFTNFTDWEYHSSPSPVPLRAISANNRGSGPRKSILKKTKAVPSVVSYTSFANMEEMLEVTIQQLSTTDRLSRIDAYKACLTYVQAFPQADLDAVGRLAPTVLDRISTDLHSHQRDVQLSVSAMKCLSILVKIVDQDDLPVMESLSRLMELSISVIQSKDVPRILTHHHLFFLTQKFSTKLMTTDRCVRIITSLYNLHRQTNGSAILSLMLTLHRQFILQYPTIMRAKVPEWIGISFAGLLSGKAEVRNQALELCVLAASHIGPSITRPLEDFLNQKHGNGIFNDWFVKLLEDLVNKREEQKDLKRAIMAPRIWSIIVLFLGSRFREDSQWTKFKPWLRLASKCFNSPDRQMKIEMITAWSRLVYATMPDASTIPEARRLLRAPIESILVSSRDFAAGVGRRILSTYYCLLYYSLRPTSTFEQIDIYWEEYVEHILLKFRLQPTGESRKSQEVKAKSDIVEHQHLYHACLVLQNLFQSGCKWNETRAVDPMPFQIDELPQLDSKWVRSRAQRACKLVSHFISLSEAWQLEAPSTSQEEKVPASLALSTWTCLMNAIKEAGSKEVTTSMDLKAAVVAVINSLRQMAKVLPQMTAANASFSPQLAFQSLFKSSLQILGEGQFVEKILTMNDQTGDLEMVNPSHRTKSSEPLRAPITEIIVSFCELLQSCGDSASDSMVNTIKELIESAWNSMVSSSTRLEFLAEMAFLLQNELSQKLNVETCAKIADVIIEVAEETIRKISESLSQHPTGRDLALIQQVIKTCLPFISIDGTPKALYDQTVATARRIGGDGAVLLAVTETHSAMVVDFIRSRTAERDTLLAYASLILENDYRPKNWGAVERGRKSLWGGISGGPAKNPDLEYTNLATLVDTVLSLGISPLEKEESATFIKFINGLAVYVSRCPPASAFILLQRIQGSLGRLIVERNESSQYGEAFLLAVRMLWQQTLAVLNDQLEENMRGFEELIVAGLSSPLATAILHPTILFWNDRMDKIGEREISFPENILATVLKLRRVTDIVLPFGVADAPVKELMASPLITRLVDQSSDQSDTSSRKPREARYKKAATTLLTPDSREDRRSARLKKRAESKERRKKLPHEDSQIQFIPIETVARPEEESQHLTTHQKEVAEIQRMEAAVLYPDMNQDEVEISDAPMSSPIVASVKRRESWSRRKSQPPFQENEAEVVDSRLTEDMNVIGNTDEAEIEGAIATIEDVETQLLATDDDRMEDEQAIPSSPADPSSLQLVEEMRASFQMSILETEETRDDVVNEQGKRSRDVDDEIPSAKRVDIREERQAPQQVLEQLRLLVNSTKMTTIEWTEEQRRELNDLVFDIQAAARGMLV